MTKFKILETTSTDAGSYSGMREFEWGSEVEGEYINAKQNSIYVLGSEFIRLGCLESAFKPEVKYMWGCFEEVN